MEPEAIQAQWEKKECSKHFKTASVAFSTRCKISPRGASASTDQLIAGQSVSLLTRV
jgi:hypothetical protein